MPIYPLGKVMEIIESVGPLTGLPMSVAYAYEDLIFMEHNAFLLQFAKEPNTVSIHRNIEAQQEEVMAGILALQKASEKSDVTFVEGECYGLEQEGDENIRLDFFPCEGEP